MWRKDMQPHDVLLDAPGHMKLSDFVYTNGTAPKQDYDACGAGT